MALCLAAKTIASSVIRRRLSTFTLPPLKYKYDALEPHIDAMTMQIHHTRHHQTYVSNLNSIISGKHGSVIKGMPLSEIQKVCSTLPSEIRTPTVNHGGGHYNHCLFFSTLTGATPNGTKGPVRELKDKIEEDFGSFEAFKEAFDMAAVKHFGSGWAWASVGADWKLFISSTANQENPLMEGVVAQHGTPIMGIDVWEHAYYLKNQNRRPEYIESFWHVLDWEQVNANFLATLEGKTAVFDAPTEK